MLRLITILLSYLVISEGQVSKYFHSNFEQKLEAILTNKQMNISSQCKNHLLHYVQNLKSGESWAMQMFDASAKGVPSGIMDGNLFDFGSFYECLNIAEEKDNVIFGKYCIAITFIEIPFQHTISQHKNATHISFEVFLAKCIPDACSTRDMENVYAEVGERMDLSDEFCQTKAMEPKLDSGGIATICLFGIIFAVVIMSTGYDVICYYLKKECCNSILIAFSILTNFRKLINVNNVPGEITCLHGIRVVSLMWVIFSHRNVTLLNFPASSLQHFLEIFLNESTMFTNTTFLAVDTFFYLSGLLISYNYMINLKQEVKFNIIGSYIQRYLRLTPALAVVMLFSITLLKHTGSGPLWPSYMEPEMINSCEKDWWRVLLYIQNIYKSDLAGICIHPTWYLSTDMQLYILSPLLLLPLKKFPKLVLLLAAFLIVCSVLSGVIVIWYYEINPFGVTMNGPEKEVSYYWYYLYALYTRACPWLIGVVMGYFVFTFKEKSNLKWLNNKTILLILWVISLTVIGTCTFAGIDIIAEEHNTIKSALHGAFARPAWAIAISWVIFACVNGHGRPVNWFLSLPFFKVLSKLSYTMYLTHILIISVGISNRKTFIPHTISQMAHDVSGDYAYAFATGLVLSLSVEIPINNFIKILKQ